MKWCDTVASRCRYGEVAERLFGEGDVIWEHSYADYQGYANVLVKLPNGMFAHYEWWYGSCSGCDDWENRNLSDDEVLKEMREETAWFNDVPTLRRYLHLDAPPPPDRSLLINPSGAFGDALFKEMAEAARAYLAGRTE